MFKNEKTTKTGFPMRFKLYIKARLNDPLLTFKVFERFIALFCTAIPVLLWLTDGMFQHPFRPSISNYVYMPHSYVFGMLLCIAAMLFIFNGAVYYRNERFMHISVHGRWYNVVLGLSLIGVICFPHLNYPVPHYVFATVFFLGNAVVTGFFYKDKDRIISIILALVTVAALPLGLFTNLISLLTAEWISLLAISIHFFLSTIRMNEPVNVRHPKQLK